MANKLPLLEGEKWAEARGALHAYTRVLGKIRAALTPAQKHSWNASVKTYARGISTPPIHTNWGAFELRLDLIDCHASIIASDGRAGRLRLVDLPANRMAAIFQGKLAEWDVEVNLDMEDFDDTCLDASAVDAVGEIWRLMIWVDGILGELRAGQRAEMSEVQLWPHHFDLSTLWISGHLVPKEDPDKAEVSDEQINIGFAFGDADIPRPYFYLTVYPSPDGFPDKTLPDFAEWNREGWTGVCVHYDALAGLGNPAGSLIHLFKSLVESGDRLLAAER